MDDRVPPLLLLAGQAVEKARQVQEQVLREKFGQLERDELRLQQSRIRHGRQLLLNDVRAAEEKLKQAQLELQKSERSLIEYERSSERQYLASRTAIRMEHENKFRSEVEDFGFEVVTGMVAPSVSALNASGWRTCVGPLDGTQNNTSTCGRIFFAGRRHTCTQSCALDPRMFCVCSFRNDLCDDCLPQREQTCGLCNARFCNACWPSHHHPCFNKQDMVCGLKWNQKRFKAGVNTEVPHYVAGHCRLKPSDPARQRPNPNLLVDDFVACRCGTYKGGCCGVACLGYKAQAGGPCERLVCKECAEGQETLLDATRARMRKRKRPDVHPERVGKDRWRFVSCGPDCVPPMVPPDAMPDV